MISFSQEEIKFCRESIIHDCRNDGRKRLDYCSCEISVNEYETCFGSSKVVLPNSGVTLHIGIKAEIKESNVSDDIFQFTLESTLMNTLNQNQKNSLWKRLWAIQTIVKEQILSTLSTKDFIYQESNKKICFYIDALCNGVIDYCDLEYLSLAVKGAMKTLAMPKFSVVKNILEDKYVFELKNEVCYPFNQSSINCLHTFGEVNGKLVLDMTKLEMASCDSLYIGTFSENGELLCVEKICGKGINPDSFVEIIHTAKKIIVEKKDILAGLVGPGQKEIKMQLEQTSNTF